MEKKVEIDSACTSLEVCLEKLRHLTEEYPEKYHLDSMKEMDEIEQDMFVGRRESMCVSMDIIFDYVVEAINLVNKVREVACE